MRKTAAPTIAARRTAASTSPRSADGRCGAAREAGWRSTPLFAAAAAAYAANCALGASVALRLIDTRDWRWVHHALYIATSTLTAVAVSSALWGRPKGASRRGAAALAPAAVPLSVIPYAGTRTRRHPAVALSAAPFFVAGVIASRTRTTRKD